MIEVGGRLEVIFSPLDEEFLMFVPLKWTVGSSPKIPVLHSSYKISFGVVKRSFICKDQIRICRRYLNAQFLFCMWRCADNLSLGSIIAFGFNIQRWFFSEVFRGYNWGLVLVRVLLIFFIGVMIIMNRYGWLEIVFMELDKNTLVESLWGLWLVSISIMSPTACANIFNDFIYHSDTSSTISFIEKFNKIGNVDDIDHLK